MTNTPLTGKKATRKETDPLYGIISRKIIETIHPHMEFIPRVSLRYQKLTKAQRRALREAGITYEKPIISSFNMNLDAIMTRKRLKSHGVVLKNKKSWMDKKYAS